MEALLIIDVQKGFLNKELGERNNHYAEENMLKLLAKFRQKNKKIIHIRHYSKDEKAYFYKEEDREFQKGFEPLNSEIVFTKNVNSGFIGTNLEMYLKENSITDLVIVGLTLPHCVSTTTRMAKNLGFNVSLIEDATASFEMKDYYGEKLKAEEVHRYNIAALNKEFAKIIKTEEFLKDI